MADVCRWWRYLGWCTVFLATVAIVRPESTTPGSGYSAPSICDVAGCNCTIVHKYWNIVNCTLENKQVVEVSAGMLAINTLEVSVSGGRELRLSARSFSALTNFQRLRVDSTAQVLLQQHAFLNVSGNSVLVQVAQCNSLRFENAAFRNMRGPVSLEVSRCAYVTVQKAVFSFLQDATFSNVLRLELAEEAFTLATRDLGHHGAVTTIRFHKVMIPVLARDVFKSSLAEVSLLESEVREVQGGAFSGITISAVLLANSSVHRIRGRAFSERTQLDNLAFINCRLHHIDTDAILAAITNLTIQNTNITTFGTGAVNAVVARFIFQNNIVDALYAGALTVRDWSRVTVDKNVFGKMSNRALDLVEGGQDGELTFNENMVRTADTGALLAISTISHSHIGNNKFGYPCHCDIGRWLDDIVGANCSDNVARTNFCTIDALLAQCYEIEVQFMLIKNFTDVYCDDGSVIQCKTFAADANVGQHNADEDNGGLVLGIVLGLVLLVAVCGTVVILLVHGGLWLKRKGYCVRFNNLHYRNDEVSTEAEDIMVGPDKPSDQLPEELTQELLQVLRDKLEDPATYHEAREMIERLYDHFIIEDSYTNNNRLDEETHLYEELGAAAAAAIPNSDTNPGDKPQSNRPFSFLRLIEEKLQLNTASGSAGLPIGSVLADEYSEPTDAEIHLYSELPAQQHAKEDRQNEINEVLTQARTPSPAVSSSSHMAYRPLPPQPSIAVAVATTSGSSTYF